MLNDDFPPGAETVTQTMEVLPNEEWLTLPQSFDVQDTDGSIFATTLIAENLSPRTYSMNNGVLCVVDAAGTMRAGIQTEARVALLKRAGYEYSRNDVLFSNGDMPVDPALNQKWRLLMKVGQLEHHLDAVRRATMANVFQSLQLGLQPLDQAKWVPLGGAEYGRYGGKLLRVPDIQDDGNPRTSLIGKYSIDAGKIFCVAPTGELFIGPFTQERLQELHSKGYQPPAELEDGLLLRSFFDPQIGEPIDVTADSNILIQLLNLQSKDRERSAE